MKTLIANLILSILLLSPSYAKIYKQELVSYFAGKDEYCLGSKKKKHKIKLSQVVRQTIVYSENDFEEMCTFIGKEHNKTLRFSASGTKCNDWKKNNVSAT